MSERQRFLKWYMNEFGEHDDARRARPFAWAAWQAACHEGWQCVPVEPTEEMVEAALDAYTPFGDMKLAIQAAVVHAPKPEDV